MHSSQETWFALIETPTVRLRRVSKRYSGAIPVEALSNVDLDILPGQFIAVLGPSGGGKSTLLNVIGLLDSPDSGSYVIDKAELVGKTDAMRTRTRSDLFAFVFQNFHLLDRRRVLDSIELGLIYRGITSTERRVRAQGALNDLGLGHLADRRANTLSGGQRQRIAIARALASGAPIVLADEPTGNLDSASAAEVMAAFERLRGAGATLVLVTHSAEIAAGADRILHVRDGLIVEDTCGPVADRSGGKLLIPSAPGSASQLRVKDLLSDCMASLRSRKARSISLIAAVALATGLAVATLGIAESARAQVGELFDARLNRDVTVRWVADHPLSGQSAERLATIPERIASIAGVEAATIVAELPAVPVQAGDKSDALMPAILRVTGDFPTAARVDMRWSAGHPTELGLGEVAIGAALAKQLELGPLDAEPTLNVGDATVRVVAIVEASPRDPTILGAVVVPRGVMEVGAFGMTRAFVLTVSGAAQQVAQQIPLVIDPFNPDLLEVEAPPDPRDLRSEVEGGVAAAMTVVTIIALIGAVGALANAMTQAVNERRGEIGLRRAVGALRRHIWWLVGVEAATVGLLGGILGLGLG